MQNCNAFEGPVVYRTQKRASGWGSETWLHFWEIYIAKTHPSTINPTERRSKAGGCRPMWHEFTTCEDKNEFTARYTVVDEELCCSTVSNVTTLRRNMWKKTVMGR